MKSTTFAAALFAVTMAANAETETIVETFESDIGDWNGGTLSTETPPTEPDKYGYPVANADHNKTLSVSGTATRTISGRNVFDMMVKLNKTDDDDLPTPDASALFAVAVDNSGNLKLYCKPTSDGTPSWSPIGQYNSGDWARLTFDVKNDAAGSFVVATNGVLTDATYYLAAKPSANIVTNVAVIGTTAIDDFVAKSGSFAPYAQVNVNGTDAVTDNVPNKYIARAGSGKTATSPIPNSSPSMTVAQAYEVGVLPTDGATFDIKEATFDGSNLTLTFPGDWPAETYTIKYGTTTECTETVKATSAVKSNGRNQVTVSIPQNFGAGNVLYYTVSR